MQADEIPQIMNNKTTLKYVGPEVDAMRAVAKAGQNRSLAQFDAAVAAHPQGMILPCCLFSVAGCCLSLGSSLAWLFVCLLLVVLSSSHYRVVVFPPHDPIPQSCQPTRSFTRI